jgi:hypothetical protein
MARPISNERDRYISGIYLDLGSKTGDPVTRTWALDHAARVDAMRGEGHEFGSEVLKSVFGRALRTYFVRTGITVPGEDATATGREVQNLSSESHVRVAESAIRAFGAPETAVRIEPPDISDSEAGHPTAVASYDLSVPGMAYLKTTIDVIAWPRESTLFI